MSWEEPRGLWAIDADTRELLAAAEYMVEVWRSEVGRERNRLLLAAAQALGPSGASGLPSARAICARTIIRDSEPVGMTDSGP